MLRKIEATFKSTHRYEIDDEDPAFEKISNEDLTRVVKLMVYTDIFQSTSEADILPLIEVTIPD